MRPKHEKIIDPRIFYCFVDLGSEPSPKSDIFLIPSKKVADAIATSHKIWLETPGKNGRLHKDSSVRRLLPDYTRVVGGKTLYTKGWMEPYRENWDQLRHFTSAVPAQVMKADQ